MMSSIDTQVRQNKDVVSRAISEVLVGENYELLEELYADDFVQHGGPIGDLHGLEALQEWFEAVHAGFSDFEATEEFSLSEDDLVASYVSFAGTHDGEFMGLSATDEYVEVTGITINRLEDGKIVESWPQTDFLGVLQQVGAIDLAGN